MPFSWTRTRCMSRPRTIGRLAAPGAKLEPVMPGLENNRSPSVAAAAALDFLGGHHRHRGELIGDDRQCPEQRDFGRRGRCGRRDVTASAGGVGGRRRTVRCGAVTVICGSSSVSCAASSQPSAEKMDNAKRADVRKTRLLMTEFLNVLMRNDIARARAERSARQGSDVQDRGGARERNAARGEMMRSRVGRERDLSRNRARPAERQPVRSRSARR